MSIRRIQSVLSILLILWIIDYVTIDARNEFSLEKVLCFNDLHGPLESLRCNIKYINRKYIKIDIRWNVTRPVHEAWIHGVYYYKFNGLTFSKFPIDLWENFCDYISHKRTSYLLEWTYGRLLNYTNFNHSCPYFGSYLLHVPNITLDIFDIQALLPSGRFRLDIDFTEHDRISCGGMKIFFSVSDHRLEVV